MQYLRSRALVLAACFCVLSSLSGFAADTSVADQLQALTQQLKQQQAQMQQQQQQIQQLQQSNATLQKQVQQQNQQLQSTLQQANDKATAAQQDLNSLHTQVDDLQTNTKATANALLDTKKSVNALENPTSIHYKGVTITPGGFLESTFFVRSRNENADDTSSFGALPFSGQTNSQMSEFRFSARASRFILAAEGMAGTTKLTGYYEVDFLGQAPTANYVQTNSFTPRMRQLWAQGEFKGGTTVSVGQYWNLLTTDRKGIALRSEFIPTTLEASYVVGYTYGRQASLRATHNFNNKVWVAGEVGNGEMNQPVGSNLPAVSGMQQSANALSPNGSTLNFLAGSTLGLSTVFMPDIIGKVAFEPGYGHYELKALVRSFRDRYLGANNYTAGYGIGWGMILPVMPKKVDWIFEGIVGRGIGRYGAANEGELTIKPNGQLAALPGLHAFTGIEYHATPKLDVFVYGGDEYVQRKTFAGTNAEGQPITVGYGSHAVDNRACGYEVAPVINGVTTACTGQNKNIGEGTIGVWYRVYKGPFGTFQYGAQYEYFWRNAFSGCAGGTCIAPSGHENVVLNTFRFILP